MGGCPWRAWSSKGQGHPTPKGQLRRFFHLCILYPWDHSTDLLLCTLSHRERRKPCQLVLQTRKVAVGVCTTVILAHWKGQAASVTGNSQFCSQGPAVNKAVFAPPYGEVEISHLCCTLKGGDNAKPSYIYTKV